MKQIIYFLALSLVFSACSKNNPTTKTTTASKYYFNCEVDGKKINVPYLPAKIGMESDKAVYLIGTAGTSIYCTGYAKQCNTTGSYCLDFSFGITGQTTGNYKPSVFLMNTYEGADTFIYSYNWVGIDKEDFTINITKIEHSTSSTSINGVIEGSFSNKIKKQQINVSGSSSVNISGNFALPL